MTLDEISASLARLREDLLGFERKYNMRTEVFCQAYSNGEVPDEHGVGVDDWSEVGSHL